MAEARNAAAELIRSARQPAVLTGGFRVAAVVGTLLNLVNQGPAILDGAPPSWAGLVMNYLIPFFVSVYSGARIGMRNQADGMPHGQFQNKS
jgi:hypothetical protein